MRVMSTFSGISAASVAWQELGFEFVAYADPAAFPAAVLHARRNATPPLYRPKGKEFADKNYRHLVGGSVPNFGDIGQITDEDLIALGDVDILEGGSPCQAFSIAGARGGFSDARGNLTLAFVQLALRMRRLNNLKFVIWENVHGVLSHKDNPLGHFLAAMGGDEHPLQPPGKRWTNAGAVYAPEAAIAWRVLDAQFFRISERDGRLLPQRRKRVFAVVSFGDLDPGQILFEPEGEGRTAPPVGEEGAHPPSGSEGGVGSVKAVIGKDSRISIDVDPTAVYALTASDHKEAQMVVYPVQNSGRLGGQAGTGIGEANEAMFTMIAESTHAVIAPTFAVYSPGLGFGAGGHGIGEPNGPMYTLTVSDQHAVVHPETVGTLMTSGAGTMRPASAHNEMDYVVVQPSEVAYVVRRLMPVECERLQGFPDGWTDVVFRGKPALDAPRYKACGNSMAVPVMNWLGRRLVACLDANKQ